MRKTLILAGLAGALLAPSAARATTADHTSAARECRVERGTTAATREAFTARYGNFGTCVSAKARAAAERERGASQACRTERGTTAESQAAFALKYGTNKNHKNAFGTCVSQQVKAAEAAAGQDVADRKRAAKQCADERGTTAATRAAFAREYGTNGNRKNAFGKCVSTVAKALRTGA